MIAPKMKIILLGDTNVGKTSLINAYKSKDQPFDEKVNNTIGGELSSIHKKINNMELEFEIWDTAGQEQYKSIVPIYAKDADGALIVFSLTNLETLEHIDDWTQFIHENTTKQCPIVYCGNKSDLTDEKQVTEQQIESKLQNQQYFPTSAKNKTNVEQAFDCLFEKAVESLTSPMDTPQPKKSGKKCC